MNKNIVGIIIIIILIIILSIDISTPTNGLTYIINISAKDVPIELVEIEVYDENNVNIAGDSSITQSSYNFTSDDIETVIDNKYNGVNMTCVEDNNWVQLTLKYPINLKKIILTPLKVTNQLTIRLYNEARALIADVKATENNFSVHTDSLNHSHWVFYF